MPAYGVARTQHRRCPTSEHHSPDRTVGTTAGAEWPSTCRQSLGGPRRHRSRNGSPLAHMDRAYGRKGRAYHVYAHGSDDRMPAERVPIGIDVMEFMSN